MKKVIFALALAAVIAAALIYGGQGSRQADIMRDIRTAPVVKLESRADGGRRTGCTALHTIRRRW